MRISTALYQAGGNFARGTKFSIIINTPPRLNSIYSKYYDVLCKTTGIPTVTHTPIEMKVKGLEERYQEVLLVVLSDLIQLL